MLTARTQLQSAFERGEIVVVCWEPGCSLHRLSHWNEERWVSFAKRPTYARYSHSICPTHARRFREEIARFFAGRKLELAAA